MDDDKISTKEKALITEIDYRPADPSDADQASELIFDTFPKLATFLFGLGDEDRAKKILSDIFSLGGHRFSYKFAKMALIEQQVAGLFIAYPGNTLSRLNWQLAKVLVKQYNFREIIILFLRALPIIFINEAASDEYLLSNLAVKAHSRGEGVGTHILSYVEETAKQEGLNKVAFMVTIENEAAQRFYERNNYHVKAEHLVSENRVSQLGQGYKRMVKELPE